MSKSCRIEHTAYVRIVTNTEITKYEARHWVGSFEQRSDVVHDTTGKKLYLILSYEPLWIKVESLKNWTITKVRIVLTFEFGRNNPVHGKYGEVIEEIPYEEDAT